MARVRGHSATMMRQRLLFAVVLGALLGLVGWALLAAAGPTRGWVALLWLISATGLVLMPATLAERRDTTSRLLGAAALLATGASGSGGGAGRWGCRGAGRAVSAVTARLHRTAHHR